jgi:hypothetical protein
VSVYHALPLSLKRKRESARPSVWRPPTDQLTCTDPCLSAGVRLPRVFDDCFGTSDHAAPLTPPWHHFNSQVSKSDKQKSQNKNKTTQGTTWKAENQSSTLSFVTGNGVFSGKSFLGRRTSCSLVGCFCLIIEGFLSKEMCNFIRSNYESLNYLKSVVLNF